AGSLSSLTLVLGTYFIASGISRAVINIQERFPGWGWALTSSLAEVFIGVLTLAGWPETSLFVLGTLVGVQLICSGATTFAVGMTIRGILTPHGHRPETRLQH